MKRSIRQQGFTLVELLVVIVVISILASVTTVAYNGAQDRARQTKAAADIRNIVAAIQIARVSTNKNLKDITNNGYTAYSCTQKAAGTDLATLPDSDECILRYKTNLQLIATAAGVTLGDMRDPWGRPYYLDENEGENGNCIKDTIAMFARPLNGSALYSSTPANNVPFGGYSGYS